MKPGAGFVGAQRLEMKLNVRSLEYRFGLCECSDLTRTHTHRAGAEEYVFEADEQLSQRIVHFVVECGTPTLVYRSNLKVILQILADSREGVDDWDSKFLQQFPRTDSREL